MFSAKGHRANTSGFMGRTVSVAAVTTAFAGEGSSPGRCQRERHVPGIKAAVPSPDCQAAAAGRSHRMFLSVDTRFYKIPFAAY